MTMYKIINFGKSLEAGMRLPSTGAAPVLPQGKYDSGHWPGPSARRENLL